MLLSPERKEKGTAWVLGGIGLVKGLFEVYVVDTVAEAKRTRSVSQASHLAVEATLTPVPDNLIELPLASPVGAMLLDHDRAAA